MGIIEKWSIGVLEYWIPHYTLSTLLKLFHLSLRGVKRRSNLYYCADMSNRF